MNSTINFTQENIFKKSVSIKMFGHFEGTVLP